MRWKEKRNNPEEAGTLLSDLPGPKQQDGWVYHPLFSELDVVFSWHRLPSEFGICSPDEDLIYMTAYTTTISKMRAYEERLRDEEMERLRKQSKAKGKH